MLIKIAKRTKLSSPRRNDKSTYSQWLEKSIDQAGTRRQKEELKTIRSIYSDLEKKPEKKNPETIIRKVLEKGNKE